MTWVLHIHHDGLVIKVTLLVLRSLRLMLWIMLHMRLRRHIVRMNKLLKVMNARAVVKGATIVKQSVEKFRALAVLVVRDSRLVVRVTIIVLKHLVVERVDRKMWS